MGTQAPLTKCQGSAKWCIRQVVCGFLILGALRRGLVLFGSTGMTLRVRALGDDEADELARMARSRALGAGLVRRAQIVRHAVEEGLSAPEIAARMGLCDATVRFWLKRFNERGLPGLEEDMRSGRSPTYTAEERSAVIKAALSRPSELGLPFASWTLDRLVAYLSEQGIGMRRSRVSEVLLAEGLKWRQEETWFGTMARICAKSSHR